MDMPMRAPLTTVVAHNHVAKVAHCGQFVSVWKRAKIFIKFFSDKLSLVKNIRIFFIFLWKDLEAEEKITREYMKSRQANLTRFLYKSYKKFFFTILHRNFPLFWIKILLYSRNCGKCSSVFLTILVNTFPPILHHLSILIPEERLPMHRNIYFCKIHFRSGCINFP